MSVPGGDRKGKRRKILIKKREEAQRGRQRGRKKEEERRGRERRGGMRKEEEEEEKENNRDRGQLFECPGRRSSRLGCWRPSCLASLPRVTILAMPPKSECPEIFRYLLLTCLSLTLPGYLK